jgi:putative DNA primase/helicase
MPDETPSPQVALERTVTVDDRGQALADLAKDDEMMAGFGKWYSEDPVGFSTALARVGQAKPKLAIRIVESFQRAVESVSMGTGRRIGSKPLPLGSVLPHPQGDDLMVPAGYALEPNGTYLIDKRRGKILIAHYPIVLEGYVRDQETGTSMVVVAWCTAGAWRRMAISRETMGVSADLARQAGGFGAPIHSANSSMIVSYFSAFEALNLAKFEECKGITRMGWTPEMDAFLIGSRLVTARYEEEIQSPATLKDGWGKAARIFLPTGPEVQRILAGYHRRGTLEGWKEALGIASKHPFALVGIYLSMLPPLMQILAADNLAFEWSGKSSVGKTTALSVAASVWGQPKLNLDPSIVSSWRVTDVYIERLLASLGDIPLFLDDTRTATPYKKNGADPIQVVYDVVAGTTKGRGTIAGTEAKRAWRTVLMSTGESCITSDSVKGGIYARTWAIGSWPWGDTSPGTAAKVLRLETVIAENYGHLGPAWAQALMNNKKVWGKWKTLYQSVRDKYGTQGVVGDSGAITGRLGKNLAALEVTANIARAILPEVFEDIDFVPMIKALWLWAQMEGSGGDVYQEAAIAMRNLAAANQANFWPRSPVAPEKDGWWGVWPLPSPGDSYPSIYIRPDIVIKKIKELGHETPMAVLLEWEKRKIIRPGHNKTTRGAARYYAQKKVMCNGAPLWVIEFVPIAENAEELEAYDLLTEASILKAEAQNQ